MDRRTALLLGASSSVPWDIVAFWARGGVAGKPRRGFMYAYRRLKESDWRSRVNDRPCQKRRVPGRTTAELAEGDSHSPTAPKYGGAWSESLAWVWLVAARRFSVRRPSFWSASKGNRAKVNSSSTTTWQESLSSNAMRGPCVSQQSFSYKFDR